MKKITITNSFKKEFQKMLKRGKNPAKFHELLDLLSSGKVLPVKYKDHPLKGNFKDSRDLHIEPDWILIYRLNGEELILERTGTHSDLLK